MDVDEGEVEQRKAEIVRAMLEDGAFTELAETGVAAIIASSGIGALKGGQRTVFARYIEPRLRPRRCEICGLELRGDSSFTLEEAPTGGVRRFCRSH
jgi:xanthine/CO dehydrogenase XdhC/CoxF family maturation factor